MSERERILVVDDESAMLRSLRRVLEPRYAVATAATAAEACALAREAPPDLAIVDVRMPNTNGFELWSELREIAPELDGIFMTGAIAELDAQLVRAIREQAFYFVAKPFDREVLLTLVERCLELRRLSALNRRHVKRLERELEEARTFQRNLLPPLEGRAGRARLSARYAPCSEVGGDLVDWIETEDARLAVVVADVSGHGVSAAMLTAIVKAAFHDAHGEHFAPEAVARRVASALRTFDDDRFVTLFAARIDAELGRVEYVNAGHPAVLAWSADGARRELGLTGAMISPAFPDLVWERAQIELGSPGRLLAYTDGVTEARGANELYGDARLLSLVDRNRASGAALLAAIDADLAEFVAGRPADDDRTLLAVEW